MSPAAGLAKTGADKVSSWRAVGDVVFGRIPACVAGVVSVLSLLGCMCVNIGGSDVKPSPDGVLVQEGKITVRPGSDQTIYYPKGYMAPPNLELEDTVGWCDIVEQKENCFRVRFKPGLTASQQTITWKTRGVQPVVAETATATTLGPPSPQPVPVAVSTNAN